MSTNICTFEGVYDRQGKFFINNTANRSLLITERKAVSVNKPQLFLLQVLPSGGRQYISSLYPMGDKEYYFDYQGKKYKLLFDDTRVEVAKF